MYDGFGSNNVKFIDGVTNNTFPRNKLINISNGEGELLSEKRNHNGLRISQKSKYYRLNGSLHLFYNKGLQNYDEYSFSNICETIDLLVNEYKIDAKNTMLSNIEFGLNIEVPFPVSLILNKIIMFQGNTFSHKKDKKMNFRFCENTHYCVKIYDKGLQHNLIKHLLRFEIKVKKMQFLKKNRIPLKSLEDLKIRENCEKVGVLLNKIFKEILFEEFNFIESQLSQKDLIFYLRVINPNYWINSEIATKAEKKKMQREKYRYKSLLEKHCLEKPNSYAISERISYQWSKLLKS